MERRKAFSVIASGAALLALAGCDAEDKPSATATVLNNENVHEAMKSVEEALDSLESNVDDFSTTKTGKKSFRKLRCRSRTFANR